MANVLVIGRGAREHVLCQQFTHSPLVEKVYCAPGNPGMLRDEIETIDINENKFNQLIDFAKENKIDLTVVGPEKPLQEGIVDEFKRHGLMIFGPDKSAAKLESSKKFAKLIMKEAKIPTAEYRNYHDEKVAVNDLKNAIYPLVIKADGLAAGKGVSIVKNVVQAKAVIHEMLGEYCFDTDSIVIEEFLEGEEFSFMAFVNDEIIIPMPLSQDHKAAYDNDEGPNTGGMGAYSPLPHFEQDITSECVKNILQPVIATLNEKGIHFCGVLYAGLIKTDSGVKVIEFNVRLGDPETVVVLPQLKTDLYLIIQKLLQQEKVEVQWQTQSVHLGVVVSSETYPQKNGFGENLQIFNQVPKELKTYYAGVTSNSKDELISDGGRIITLTTESKCLLMAKFQLYDWLNQQDIGKLRYRKDIGDKCRMYQKRS